MSNEANFGESEWESEGDRKVLDGKRAGRNFVPRCRAARSKEIRERILERLGAPEVSEACPVATRDLAAAGISAVNAAGVLARLAMDLVQCRDDRRYWLVKRKLG